MDISRKGYRRGIYDRQLTQRKSKQVVLKAKGGDLPIQKVV